MNKKNFVLFEAPSGKALKCKIHFGRILAIRTNFDAMRYIDFAENQIINSREIISFERVGVYDDETGYWLFLLRDNFDRAMLLDDVSVWFNHSFD